MEGYKFLRRRVALRGLSRCYERPDRRGRRGEGNISRQIAAILVVCALFLACAAPRTLTDFKKVDIESEPLLDSLSLRDARLESVSGRMSVRFESPASTGSFSADYFFARPDSFRANIRGLVGSVPAVAVSIGDSMAVYIPSKETLFVALDGEGVNPVIGLKISMADLVSALIGRLNIDERRAGLRSFDKEGQSYELIFEDGPLFTRLEILPSAWAPRSVQVFSEDGGGMLDIGYYDFIEVSGIARPRKIVITNPIRGEKVMIEIEKEFLGGKIPDGIFHLKVPPNIEVWHLYRSENDN